MPDESPNEKKVRFQPVNKRKRAESEEDGDDGNWDNSDQSQQVALARKQRRKNNDDEDDDDVVEDTTIDTKTSLQSEGIQIEPFHMKNEENDGLGYFEGDTYVFRRGETDDGEPDAWLDEIESVKPFDNSALKPTKDGAQSLDEWTEQELFAKILPNLASDSETILQAISRYSGLSKKAETDTARQLATDSFNDLTEAASALMLQGLTNIYQMSRSRIQQRTTPSSLPAKQVSTSSSVNWEYKGKSDGKVHGPFTSRQMLDWTRSGYFVGESAVQIRIHGQVQSTKDDLLSDLMDDEGGDWLMSDTVDFVKYL